jgi:ADP-ribosylglycohydrolase
MRSASRRRTCREAESAILLAANVGGDSDSVASIAGAILGARHSGSVNSDWHRVVEAVNDHQLGIVAEGLSALRVQKRRRSSMS